MADPDRVSEFCDLYESGELDDDTRFALMQLIVSSLDDLLRERESVSREAQERVERLLWQDFVLCFHIVHYWSVQEETDPETYFAVTPMMRQIWQACFKPEHSIWIDA